MFVGLYSFLNYPACKAHAPYYIVVLVCLVLPYSFTFFHKRRNCPGGWGGVTEHKMWFWLSLQTVFFWIQHDIIINVHRSSSKVSVIIITVLPDLNFLDGVLKFLKYQILWKCFPWSRVVLCLQTERQTWRSQQQLFTVLRTRLKWQEY